MFKELFISFLNIPQCNTLINSILTGVKRNHTMQFFSLSCHSFDNNITIPSLQVEELLKHNQTLRAVKLDIPIKGILPSLCIIPVNVSYSTKYQ